MKPGLPAAAHPAVSDDGRLMEQIGAGSAAAFEQLYRRYRVRALRIARGVCRDESAAEDAVQDAFASIWRSRSTYRAERGGVAAWLLTAVRYRALAVARRSRRGAAELDRAAPIESCPDPDDLMEQAAGRAEAAYLHGLVGRLPRAQREVIALSYFGGLSHAEIAARLRLPAGTVKGRVRLGLQKLRGGVGALRA